MLKKIECECGKINIININKISKNIQKDRLGVEKVEFLETNKVKCRECGRLLPL